MDVATRCTFRLDYMLRNPCRINCNFFHTNVCLCIVSICLHLACALASLLGSVGHRPSIRFLCWWRHHKICTPGSTLFKPRSSWKTEGRLFMMRPSTMRIDYKVYWVPNTCTLRLMLCYGLSFHTHSATRWSQYRSSSKYHSSLVGASSRKNKGLCCTRAKVQSKKLGYRFCPCGKWIESMLWEVPSLMILYLMFRCYLCSQRDWPKIRTSKHKDHIFRGDDRWQAIYPLFFGGLEKGLVRSTLGLATGRSVAFGRIPRAISKERAQSLEWAGNVRGSRSRLLCASQFCLAKGRQWTCAKHRYSGGERRVSSQG